MNRKDDYVLAVSEEGFHRLAYTEWLNADPIPVICIHGLTRNRHDFDALGAFLAAQGRRVVSIDIVGRGDSDWLKNPTHYHFNQYVHDVTTLIASLGVKKVDIVGTSMGGLIGMIMASFSLTPVRKLVMNDVSPQIPVKALWRMGKYLGKEPFFDDHNEAKKYFKTIYHEFGIEKEQDWDYFTLHSIKKNSKGRYQLKLDPEIKHSRPGTMIIKEFFHHPHKALEGIFFDVDMWSIWEKVHIPVLVIRGAHSDLLLAEHVEKMSSVHQQVCELLVDNAGHAPALLNVSEQEYIYNWLK